MGKIFVPTYATLSMGYFEINLYSSCTFIYGELLAEYIKGNWNRFSDDCSTVLRSTQIDHEELLLTLNKFNPKIQFTMENNQDQKPFLGILIKRNENAICIDLYHKLTDTQRSLLFITFFLARRNCTIAEIVPRSSRFGKLTIRFIKIPLPIIQESQNVFSIPQENL